MKANRIFFKLPSTIGKSFFRFLHAFAGAVMTAEESDRRLTYASVPVFFLFSLLFSHYYLQARSGMDPVKVQFLQEIAPERSSEKIFPVLITQPEFEEEDVPDQQRALSDRSVRGRGGITKEKGFHTLTEYDTFLPQKPSEESASSRQGRESGQQSSESMKDLSEEDVSDVEYTGDLYHKKKLANKQNRDSSMPSGSGSSTGEGRAQEKRDYRIPTNYRFRRDFVLQYDGSRHTAIATKELVGFSYFKGMMRQIRESFAPPGYNFAYQDRAGTVISQPIKPQSVQVLFSLDEEGYVRDVRVVSSLGQEAVDRACMDTLRNQNFGRPPPEIFQNGNVFGINFIFPSLFDR